MKLGELKVQANFVGADSLKSLESILREFDSNKILLVTGKQSYVASGSKDLIEPILKGLSVKRFSSFSENPKLEEAKSGLELMYEFKPDLIIALGGGSVIDMAKTLNILASCAGRPEEWVCGTKELQKAKLPLVAIPTTAGTGSESTHFAVIYMNGEKFSLAHQSILPVRTILDPNLTLSCPAYLTACAGFDALCQAIESFWAVASTRDSRLVAKEAMVCLKENIIKAVNNPDLDSRWNMMTGANLAGKAINISKTTVAHAVSYPITSLFNVPHGHAVSLTLAEFLAINLEMVDVSVINDDRGRNFVKERLMELLSIFDCKSASEFLDFWKSLLLSCGLSSSPSEIGIKTVGDRKNIADQVNLERLNNNPVQLGSAEIIRALSN